ncbi:MAG: BA14K family protein [Pseudolabrys sp.]|nr:BA14K family protein [Pseudolabrys sp.]
MRINLKTIVAALAITATTLVAVVPADAQRRHYRGHDRGGAVIGGLAAGAILGGIIASQQRPYYGSYGPYGGYAAAPGYYGRGGDADAYCFSRFKSYDPRSGTYLGYDGYRHPCP